MSVAVGTRLGVALTRLLAGLRAPKTLKLFRLPEVAERLRQGQKVTGITKSGGFGIRVKFSDGAPLPVSFKTLRRIDPAFSRHFERVTGGGGSVASTLEGLEPGRLGFIKGRTTEGLLRSPVSTILGGALIADIATREAGLPLAAGAQRAVTGESFLDPETSFSVVLRQQQELRKREALRRAEISRIQRLMAQNMSRLATAAPHLYNQVLAGQQLPAGAVVLGGEPREDLMEALAFSMASGSLRPDNEEEDLLTALATR